MVGAGLLNLKLVLQAQSIIYERMKVCNCEGMKLEKLEYAVIIVDGE